MLSYAKYEENIRVWHEGDHNLSWAIFDFSGNLIKECNRGDFLFPGLTEEEIEEAKNAISKMSPAPSEDAYLRFGDLPAGGRSRNHATGETENGVSCYALAWDLVNQCYRRTGTGLDGAAIAYIAQNAPMFLLTGSENGKGSDGEPVLSDAKILAELTFSEERKGYVIK